MNIKNRDFKDLTEKWTRKATKTSMYRNKDLTESGRGIDYSQFIQLRFHSINEKHIAEIYSIEGWFLLWSLMCQAKLNQTMFLETTINTIYQKINKKITTDNIKKYLIKLQDAGVLKLNKTKGININTPIQIFIAYNNNEYYPLQDNNTHGGYRALPVGFIETVLDNVSVEEWAVFTVLCVRYRYWQTKIEQDVVGNVYYNLYLEHYAFPTMEQIGEIIGRKKSQVAVYIDKLANNGLEIIKVYSDKTEMKPLYNEEGKFIGNKRKNYIYYIPLFERVEYIYQHIIQIDTRDKKVKKNNVAHFDDIATSPNFQQLNNADYFMAYFPIQIEAYIKALEKNDKEAYTNLNKTCEHENGLTNRPLEVVETVENIKESANVINANFG